MLNRPGAAEVAHAGVVGALLVIDLADQLRDDEIEVRVALAVGVGGHVDGHPLEIRGQIGAVIEVEAAQEILVGLAAATVLGHDDTGDRFHDLAGPENGPGWRDRRRSPRLRSMRSPRQECPLARPTTTTRSAAAASVDGGSLASAEPRTRSCARALVRPMAAKAGRHPAKM